MLLLFVFYHKNITMEIFWALSQSMYDNSMNDMVTIVFGNQPENGNLRFKGNCKHGEAQSEVFNFN